jgi:hypothetical protein
MPQRKYSKQRCKVTKVSKRIILPIELSTYNELSREAKDFRAWLDTMIATYPELFPVDIEMGYTLHDILPPSVKLPDVRLRRIRLKAQDQNGCRPVFTIASSDLMPYMTGYTDEWEKPLFLRRFSVPFWGRSYVFGRNDSYWYRLSTHVRRYEIVGTTVKAAGKLPEHLLADEKHARFNGHKAYIATTVGADCVLGASVALNADEAALTEAYSQFKQEAQNIDFDYTPGCLMPASFLHLSCRWQTRPQKMLELDRFISPLTEYRIQVVDVNLLKQKPHQKRLTTGRNRCGGQRPGRQAHPNRDPCRYLPTQWRAGLDSQCG